MKKILQIVVGARRPLTVEEMAMALGIATSTHVESLHKAKLDPIRLQNSIRSWCGLFIFINHTRIYLIHQTAKEFLICNSGLATPPPSPSWKHCLNRREIENIMTRICTSFLCLEDYRSAAQTLPRKFEDKSRIDDVAEKNNHIESFFAYSAEHWPHHFRDADIPMNEDFTATISQFYDTDRNLFNVWFSIFWKAKARIVRRQI